ncbi:hypothetical protein [Micromonospora sp. NPDC007230]|uniref:hypothetical protein n=1 Tax=Micromonospora sp. NPDC007230 TaxID=3364237 RepID=UPI00368DC2E1
MGELQRAKAVLSPETQVSQKEEAAIAGVDGSVIAAAVATRANAESGIIAEIFCVFTDVWPPTFRRFGAPDPLTGIFLDVCACCGSGFS